LEVAVNSFLAKMVEIRAVAGRILFTLSDNTGYISLDQGIGAPLGAGCSTRNKQAEKAMKSRRAKAVTLRRKKPA